MVLICQIRLKCIKKIDISIYYYYIGSEGGTRTPDISGMNRSFQPAELPRHKSSKQYNKLAELFNEEYKQVNTEIILNDNYVEKDYSSYFNYCFRKIDLLLNC